MAPTARDEVHSSALGSTATDSNVLRNHSTPAILRHLGSAPAAVSHFQVELFKCMSYRATVSVEGHL